VPGTVTVSGWTVDPRAPAGTGIDQVQLFLDGGAGVGSFVAGLPYGVARPDVAAYLGNARFTNSGYSYQWNLTGIAPGAHTLVIYTHSTISGWVYVTRPITVPPPLIAIDAPPPNAPVHGAVDISGWAADPRAATGTGIDQMQLFLDGGAGQGIFVAGMAYGSSRPDVAAYLGDPRFTATGYNYHFNLAGIAPGTHTLVIYAHSTVSGWSIVTRTVTVS